MSVDFSQVQSFDDLCREVGRVVLSGFELDPIDFAGKKKMARRSHNCKPARSHGCVRQDGSMYCISLARKCRMGVSVKGKAVADYVSGKVAKQSSTASYRKALDDLSKDPATKLLLSLMVKKTSDKKIREATGLSQEDLLQRVDKISKTINKPTTQSMRDRIAEIYA